jgi:hypothetical protein
MCSCREGHRIQRTERTICPPSGSHCGCCRVRNAAPHLLLRGREGRIRARNRVAYSKPSARARSTAWRRLWTSSFRLMLLRWLRTVPAVT